MSKEIIGHLEAELPPLQRLVRPYPKLGIHVDHLRVRAGQVGHVGAHQLPDQVVVQAGTVSRRHDDSYVGDILRRDQHD